MGSYAERVIYSALKQGPVWGIGLVRDFGLNGSRVFHVLRDWHKKGWVTECKPPEEAEEEALMAVWYNITLAGQSHLANRLP